MIPEGLCGGEEHWWEAQHQGQDGDNHQAQDCRGMSYSTTERLHHDQVPAIGDQSKTEKYST
jgi:hypothetical protein